MTYWLKDTTSPTSQNSKPKDSSILIIGSGITGVSVAYFLLKEKYSDIALVDCGTENASYFRNAGHILHGACENYKAMSSIHGREKTKTIFQLSQQFCEQIKDTINTQNLDCDYHQGNYLVLPSNQKERQELADSTIMMDEDGFSSSHIISNPEEYGFKSNFAKVCTLSAQANPTKFRNQLLQQINSSISYHSYKVKSINEVSNRVEVTYFDDTKSYHDALVIAANVYSPLFSEFFSSRKLVEPFRGQIIVSKPLTHPTKRMQFSLDHGYVYGTTTIDNRFLIGGWRNNVTGQEVGSYELTINPLIEEGLKQFTKDNTIFTDLEWDYSWSGIMGSSNTGFPHIGPTNSPIIFTCAGCTGYGFGWFHGSAKMLVDIMSGNALPAGYNYFNPNK